MVGDVVGHENIVSAPLMYSAIVVFVIDLNRLNKLIQEGVVINNELIMVSPQRSPSKNIVLSNVPPFISDKAVSKELDRYGQLVSLINKIPLGCKPPPFKHLVFL